MAARKTTSQSGPAKRTTSKTGGKGRSKAPDPVIIEPPKQTKKPAAAAKPEVIEAIAQDVTPKSKDTAEATAASNKPTPPKQANPATKSPAQETAARPAPQAESGKSRPVPLFFAFVAGGVIAAGIGYVGARYLAPPRPDNSTQIATVRAAIDARVTKLDDRLTALEARDNTKTLADLRAELDALKAETGKRDKTLADAKAQLDKALAALQSAGNQAMAGAGQAVDGATTDIIDTYGKEIAALKAQLAQQAARVDQVSNTASAEIKAARQKVVELSRTAASAARNLDLSQSRERLRRTLEAGKAYGDVLTKLAAQAVVDIPEALRLPADKGVVPLLTLQQEFPSLARRALKASIKAAAQDQGIGAKLMAFLKAEVGARSLDVKQGDDPDALLSQAEAALNAADLKTAVQLVRKLPKAGVAEMADWLNKADTRLAAEAALDDFDKSLGGGK